MTELLQVRRGTIDRMQVRITHLDRLLSLAGEVIITSANLQELERRVRESVTLGQALRPESLEVVKTSNEASRRVSQDLHDLVMAIRLVEIGETLRLFRRPVRDLARTLGRDVELLFEGEETLVDKALAERLVDPMLHLLRNAVDHGLESPLERARAGKPPQGKVTVTAIDREHHTEIAVSDDGRGFDADAVRAEALARGLSVDGASVADILCRPGFSMAAAVTATSGRGVGLDLVRTTVEDFGGTVAVETTPGQGTIFRLTVPKLRAVNIVDALTMRAGHRLFALPIEHVVASLAVNAAQVKNALGRGRYFTHRGEPLVLHDLLDLLGEPPAEEKPDPIPVVVVQGKAGRIALSITEFLGPQKLVNVPLNGTWDRARAVAGTAVFTGGRLGLTLNVDALASEALDGAASALGGGPAGGESGSETASVPGARQERSGGLGESSGAGAGPRADAGASAGARATGVSGTTAATSAGAALRLQAADAEELRSELRQNLQKLQESLLDLESTPGETEPLHEAFRRLHAAKGDFTMLEAEAAAGMAHHLETLLDLLRSHRVETEPRRVDLLLDATGWLLRAAEAPLGAFPEVDERLRDRLVAEAESGLAGNAADSEADLLGRTFALTPTLELQVICALKRGERTLETFVQFDPGRQPEFLTAYLILRRLGMHGTVLATLPGVEEIEQGHCGTAVKVLWSTARDEEGLGELFEQLGRYYGLSEASSVPVTVFRYER
jgi:chemotaxis protein histidine kinase CheA